MNTALEKAETLRERITGEKTAVLTPEQLEEFMEILPEEPDYEPAEQATYRLKLERCLIRTGYEFDVRTKGENPDQDYLYSVGSYRIHLRGRTGDLEAVEEFLSSIEDPAILNS